MILLNDLLRLSGDGFSNAKVRFNQNNGEIDPIEEFKRDPDATNNSWLFWTKKVRYFQVGQTAICLVKIRGDLWLLTTVKRVTRELDVRDGVNYEGEEIEALKPYFGRVIVRYHKSAQSQCMYYSKICDQLEVSQILPDTFDDDDFPGYDKVLLMYPQLKGILDRDKKDWIAALEGQKAVYLITDRAAGKLYVGSATAESGMLLSRWRAYAENGHGGNKRLRELVEREGIGYVYDNFQYAILENYNAKIDDNVILTREAWWKEVLGTREFGYNAN